MLSTYSVNNKCVNLKTTALFFLHGEVHDAYAKVIRNDRMLNNLARSAKYATKNSNNLLKVWQPPLFSVVIPLFNKRENIIKTIDSVLAQTYDDFEVIVVDDGSNDGGGDLVDWNYGDEITLLRQKNGGVSRARNVGVQMAMGEYVAFLDADDFWSPHFLQELSVLVKKYPKAGMVATSYQYYESDGHYVTPKIRFGNQPSSESLIDSYFAVASRGDLPFNASSVAIKQSLLKKLDGFPENEGMGEDQCLWSRIALNSTIAYSPRALSFYNRSGINRACNSCPPFEECGFSRRLMAVANDINFPVLIRSEIIDYTAVHILDLAERNIRVGSLDIAARLLADKRCRRKPLKCFKVNTQLQWSFFQYWFESLFISEKI